MLTSSGGSGDGAVSFATISSNCSIAGTSLTASSATTCVVAATKAASTGYLSTTSSSKSFFFNTAPIAQATLAISNTTLMGTIGIPIILKTSGGSGDGPITFTTNTPNCSITGISLMASSATTCVVTATKEASVGYLVAMALPASFTFPILSVTCAAGGICGVGSIGPGGGTVFYVDSSEAGFNEIGAACSPHCHYLEAAPTTGNKAWTDSVFPWSSKSVSIGKYGTDVGDGFTNTLAMAAQDPTPGYAATAALAYEGPSSLTDWFLPSRFELSSFADTVEGLKDAGYWSSTEGGPEWAYLKVIHVFESHVFKGSPEYVRPIRAF